MLLIYNNLVKTISVKNYQYTDTVEIGTNYWIIVSFSCVLPDNQPVYVSMISQWLLWVV